MKTRALIFCYIIGMLYAINAQAQTGYIYVHKKTLDESSSPDVPFSVSGGSTVVPNFQLNDKPDQIALLDIGCSSTGTLWATANVGGALYYRRAGTTNWVATNVASGALRVDGGLGETAYYTTSTGVYLFDGITSTSTLIYSGATRDIGSGWNNTPYLIDATGNILKYSGAGTTWTAFYSANTTTNLDVNPTNGNVYATNTAVTNVYQLTPAAVATAMGIPTSQVDFKDVAVDALGNVFVSGIISTAQAPEVSKWAGGTSWDAYEPTAAYSYNLTGGSAGQMWSVVRFIQNLTPYHNIFSRSLNGSTPWWIDDERVRTSVTNGNSEMIPVAPGTYTITETVPGGWDLQRITIYDPSSNSTSNLVANTATLTVANNEVVHVIFQNGLVNPVAMTNSCINLYNEDFGSGSTGTYGPAFLGQTSYHYLGNATRASDGYYKLVSQAFPDFNTWQAITFYDHTSNNGTGRMLAVNAAFDQNEFFRRRFTGVVPGASYDFSAWIANLTPTALIDPNVSFQVIDPATGTILASNTTGNLTGSTTTWLQYTLTFTATTSEIDLLLINNNIGGDGNDLAIDDISFGLSAPNQPVVTVANATCSTPTGSLTVTSPLGASLEYSINGTTYQSSPVFTSLNVPNTYSVTARYAGLSDCISPPTSVTLNTAICGSVFNDANGLTDNTVNGPGVNGTSVSGTPLYASLVSGGVVIATVPITSTGAYSFTNVTAGSYSVVLTTNAAGSTTPSLPTSWTSTGENIGTGTGSDGSVNGILPVTVSGSPVTNANLGIEQVPTAGSGVNTVANAGGTTPVPVPTNTFTNTTVSSDVTPGTVTSIIITGFPTNTTSLTINGTVYTPGTFPAGGVVVPTDGSGNPTVPILVDPTNDANPVSIPFKAIDNAGVQSPNTGTAVLNFPPPISLSGNVLNDANGLTDNTVNGPGVNGTSVSGTPLYASLVSGGVVIATVPITSTGAYSFTNVTAGSYSVVLTTNAAGSTTPSLPTSWTSTGENLGTGTGSDGSVNGILPVTVGSTSVTDANLGIEQRPVVTGGGNPTQVNPGGTIAAPVSSTLFTGTDPEDGTYPNNLTGRTVTLTPATNGTLYYNGNPITATTVIPNFDPTKVTLDPTATGATTGTGGAAPDPTFTYTVTDNAGVVSLPQTIIVPFTAAMPVSLVSFTAKAQPDQRVLLEWATAWERSNKGYTLERSKDLLTFETVGQVSDVAGTSNSVSTYRFVDASPYRGTSYYRLSQTDLDGTTKAYPAVSVVIRSEAYGIFPNPVRDGQFTLNLDEPLTAQVKLYTADGRGISLQKTGSTSSSLILKATQPLPSGVYVLTVQERGQTRRYRMVVN